MASCDIPAQAWVLFSSTPNLLMSILDITLVPKAPLPHVSLSPFDQLHTVT